MQAGGREHGMQENGAVGHVPIAIGQRGVGSREFAQRQLGKRRAGFADGFRHEIADGAHGFARGFAGHQFLRHGGGVGAAGGAIQQRPVQLSVIVIHVANEITDARSPQPWRRGAGFGREGFDVLCRPGESGYASRGCFGRLQALVRTAHPLVDGHTVRRGEGNGFGHELVRHLEGFVAGQERPAMIGNGKLHFDGGANIHIRQIGDEDFAARVAFGGGIPAGVHHIDFTGGNGFPLARFGNDHAADQARILGGGIIIHLQLRLPLLAVVGEDLLGIFDVIHGRVRIGNGERFAGGQNFGIGGFGRLDRFGCHHGGSGGAGGHGQDR